MNAVKSEAGIALTSPPESIAELKASLDRRLWTCTAFDHDRDGHAWMQTRLPEILVGRVVSPAGERTEHRIEGRPTRSRFRLPGTRAGLLSVPPLAVDFDQLLGLLGTRGLAVWHDGAIVSERYAHGHSTDSVWPLWSVSKVVVAMLAYVATVQGLIDPDLSVADYWPELQHSPWTGVSVKQCLGMLSGVAFEEEELDLLSDTDYAALLSAVAFGSIDDFLIGLHRRSEPGTEFRYSSADTEVAAGAVCGALGASLTELTERWIWSAAPIQADAVWLCDPRGREFASGGLAATLRDSLGLGILLSGHSPWGGVPTIAGAFADRLSTPPGALFEMPGAHDLPLVLWEQVFVPHDPALQAGDFMAAGTYGQAVYVNPGARTVIAHHGVDADVTTEYIDFFRLFMTCRQIATDLAA